MKHTLIMLRIDPTKKAVVPVSVRVGKNAAGEVRRLCRAKEIGWRELLQVGETTMVVAGGLDVDEAMNGWRLPGSEDTAGISILFGKGKESGGMADCPVSAAWVQERIIWLAGEDVVGLKERAESMLPSLPPEIRIAVREALPVPDGSIWLLAKYEALFDPVLALGLGTPSTKGQRLSPVGVEIHSMLLDAAKTETVK